MAKAKTASKRPPSALRKRIWKNRELYILVLPVIIYYILFHYKPMYGVIIAFMDYKPRLGMAGSAWVGFKHFENFFGSVFFASRMWNTLRISLATLIFGFPAPIIFALLMNELRGKAFPRIVQTITYMPHFISMVVLCAMIREFVRAGGFINEFFVLFGYPEGKDMLNNGQLFTPIYVISNIWQGIGWGSIVYLAALTGIDMQLYEAAKIDGAGRWKQTLHVTLPCIIPTIVIMFIMRCGQVMSVGYEKIILLYNESTYEYADVISTYVYRVGLVQKQYSYSAAVGLFNSIINFILVILANFISGKVSETSLW